MRRSTARRGLGSGPGVFAILLLVLVLPACAPRVAAPGPMMDVATQAPGIEPGVARMADGALLPLRVWRPEDPQAETSAAIVALHGFNDYGTFFETFGEYLAARGIVSYAYDQRGFGAAPNTGLWAGADAYPADLRAVVAMVRARHPGVPVFVFGESMGGAAAMVALAEPPGLDADGVILAAPAVWARETMPFYQRWLLDLSAHVVPWASLSGRGLDIRPSDNIEMLKALGRDPLVIKETRIDTLYGLVNLMDRALAASEALGPGTLILYGANDDVIRKGPTIEMLRRLPDDAARRPRVALYDTGYHMLIRDLGAETVWRDVAQWIADPSGPLPSGADAAGAAFAAGEPYSD
ncbi:MAG: alpha/beta hydrolase [Rhodospirillales bacterium]